ncbi:hypothetical protein [Actinoplanes sp. NPDC048796]|uniref:hypothetical protein n=1 Tax=Actinoplanes sp. NPDC048796 TaxID=3155640 RepID=UPI00340815FA
MQAAIGVLGAVSVAAALRARGEASDRLVRVEHLNGFFDAYGELEGLGPRARLVRGSVVRTARKLADGLVWPRSGKAVG